MAKKTNKFNISINSIGTTEMNVEGNKELVRDIARMIINPIENHRVDLLENELLRTKATVDDEISQLHKKHEELERSKSIQAIQLEQLEKKVEFKDERPLKLTSKGISIEDIKASDEYNMTSGLNNGIENRTDRIEKTVSGVSKAISNIQTALYKTGKNKLDKQKEQEDQKPKRKRAYKLKGSEQDYAYKESDGFNIGEMLNAYTVEKDEEVISHNDDKYSGIKVTDDGEEKYQCRYVCPNCEHKGKRFVFEHNNVAYCHECNEKMKLHSVKSLTGQEKDIFNNYYAAGLYQPIMENKRKEDK